MARSERLKRFLGDESEIRVAGSVPKEDMSEGLYAYAANLKLPNEMVDELHSRGYSPSEIRTALDRIAKELGESGDSNA